jgi:hypothetical protein
MGQKISQPSTIPARDLAGNSRILQRAAVNTTEPAGVPPIVHEVLHSPGQPLDDSTRSFMESRFGQDLDGIRPRPPAINFQGNNLAIDTPSSQWEHEADQTADQVMQRSPSSEVLHDFSGVHIHTDSRAAESAEAVNALAYAVGPHIVFGPGQYAPHATSGKRLLAHELTHVIQQTSGLAASGLYRVRKSDCSADCMMPDSPGAGAASAWQLTLAVDREAPSVLTALKTGNVGHTWVKLSDNAGERFSYGFWPQTGFNSKKPFSSVPGCVHHPDTAHEPPRAVEYREVKYDLKKPEYDKAIAHAQQVCSAEPDYNLITYNCTSFAIDVTKAAGASPPASTTLAVHNPNALATGMEKNRGEGHPGLGALLGGLGGAALGAGIGSLLGPVGALVGGLIGGIGGLIGGLLIGDVV